MNSTPNFNEAFWPTHGANLSPDEIAHSVKYALGERTTAELRHGLTLMLMEILERPRGLTAKDDYDDALILQAFRACYNLLESLEAAALAAHENPTAKTP